MNKLSIKVFLKILATIPATGWKNDVILCYHDVNDDGWEFSVSKEQFNDQIKTLQKHFEIVSLSEILDVQKTSSRPRLAITFDDGYNGVFKNAYPILKTEKVPGTVFVIGTDFVNPKGNLKSVFLNTEEVLKLKKDGWEIGFHTANHKDLSHLNLEELNQEISIGKTDLEKRLRIQLNYFAYPSGRHSNKVIDCVKKTRFKSAFTVSGNKLSSVREGYKISRITVSKYLSAKDLVALLTPTGIVINRLFTTLWRIKDDLTEGWI